MADATTENTEERVEFDEEEDEIQDKKQTTTATSSSTGDYSMRDLFGSDSEDEDEEFSETYNPSSSTSVPVTSISRIEIPPVQLIPAKGLSLFKLPASLKIEPREYHADQILNKSKDNDDDFRITSTVRWRQLTDSKKRESNARIVKWSDGSYTLHVGNETFDMAMRDMSKDNTHLYNEVAGNVIYGQGKFSKRLVFQPTVNRLHKTLQKKKPEADATLLKGETKLTFVSIDPEHVETQTHRADVKKQVQGMKSKRQKIEQKNAKAAKRNLSKAKISDKLLEEGLVSDEEDADEHEGSGDIGAIKKKMKKTSKRKYSDEEEEEEEEDMFDEEDEVDDDDDEEDDYKPTASSKKKARR